MVVSSESAESSLTRVDETVENAKKIQNKMQIHQKEILFEKFREFRRFSFFKSKRLCKISLKLKF